MNNSGWKKVTWNGEVPSVIKILPRRGALLAGSN